MQQVNLKSEAGIKAKLRRAVSGQDEVVDLLSYLGHMYSIQTLAQMMGVDRTELPKLNCLITGPTGYGKTFLIQRLAECLDVPYTKVDCTSIMPEGWRGMPLSYAMRDAAKKSAFGIGIIHFDEFDKISVDRENHGTGSSDAKQDLQNALLDILDLNYQPVPESSNSLVILTGSFQVHRNHKPNNTIGFQKDISQKIERDPHGWKEEIKKLGFMHEFAARIVRSAELDAYTKEDIKNIILNTSESAYVRYIKATGRELTDVQIDEIVDGVLGSPNGLREIESLMFDMYYRGRTNG